MAAALLWVRSNLRSHWRSAALVVLIAGLCGGLTMAAVAGARRTSTAFVRFVSASKEPQIFVAAPDRETARLSADVMRAKVDPELVAEAVFLAAQPADSGAGADVTVVGSLTDVAGGELLVPKIVSGALPVGPRDVAVNEVAAHDLGVGPGDRFAMLGYSQAMFEACASGAPACAPDVDLGEVTVTGVLRSPEDITPELSGSLTIDPSLALTRDWVSRVAAQQWYSGALVADTGERAQLLADLTAAIGAGRVTGGSADVFIDADSDGDPTRTIAALDFERNGLLILALLTGLSGLVAIPQALARQQSVTDEEQAALRALGSTTRSRVLAVGLWSLLVGAASAAVAVVGAIAMSPAFPIGLARRAEPSLGYHADWPVLLAGLVATLLTIVATALLVAALARRRSPIVCRGVVARLFGSAPPVASTAGRFLLDRGRLSSVARTALSTGVLGVAIMVSAATVVRSQDHLVARPDLYGAPWDVQGSVADGTPDPAALVAVRDSADIAAAAVISGGRLDVGGTDVGAVGIEAVKGALSPTILAGRTAKADGEIVLSPRLMDDQGLHLGDTVDVGPPDAAARLTVVGRGIPITIGSYTSDLAVTLGAADFERYAHVTDIEGEGGVVIAVQTAPGADLADVHAVLAPISGGGERLIGQSFRPASIANLDRVKRVPQIIIGFAALLTVLVLTYALVTVATRRRHDLAVLRALGMRPGAARRVMWWHGGFLSVFVIVVGVPIGLIGGRLLWHAISASVDSKYVPLTPALALAVVAVGLLGTSIAAGAAYAHRGVPRDLAPLLRSE